MSTLQAWRKGGLLKELEEGDVGVLTFVNDTLKACLISASFSEVEVRTKASQCVDGFV